MKKITLLLVAVLMLCVLASCDHGTTKHRHDNYTAEMACYYGTLNQENNNTKMQLFIHTTQNDAYLHIWTKGVGQTDFNEKPDVSYKGTCVLETYEVLVNEAEKEYNNNTCITLNFTDFKVQEDEIDTVKQSYKDQMSLYSGSFDVELVTYNLKESHNGGWVKKCPEYGKNTINFVVTQHPQKDTNQSYLLGQWKELARNKCFDGLVTEW